jgi:hypothetical protein
MENRRDDAIRLLTPRGGQGGPGEARSLEDADALARDPRTPEPQLRRLARNWGDQIAAAVASNPLAPQQLLADLSRHATTRSTGDVTIDENLGLNPSTPDAVLDTIVQRGRLTPLVNPRLSGRLFLSRLIEIVSSEDLRLESALALASGNIACPSRLWELSATSKFPTVRRALIDNPAAPDDLKALASLVS